MLKRSFRYWSTYSPRSSRASRFIGLVATVAEPHNATIAIGSSILPNQLRQADPARGALLPSCCVRRAAAGAPTNDQLPLPLPGSGLGARGTASLLRDVE